MRFLFTVRLPASEKNLLDTSISLVYIQDGPESGARVGRSYLSIVDKLQISITYLTSLRETLIIVLRLLVDYLIQRWYTLSTQSQCIFSPANQITSYQYFTLALNLIGAPPLHQTP